MKDRHIDPALHNRLNMASAPYLAQTKLFLAKMVASHPQNGTIDVAIDGAPGQGGFYSNVPVMSWSYGSLTGQTYLPNVDLASPIPVAEGTYDQPIASGKEDVWCVCGHLDGRANRTVCLGFLSMPGAQIHTIDPGFDVKVHESGVYQLITNEGHVELHLPDGSFIVVASDTSSFDMTSQNPAWNPATTTSDYNITLNIKGNVSLTVNGTLTANVNGDATINGSSITLNNGSEGVARKGDTVSVDVSGTTYTGTITSGSETVFSG